MLLFLFLLLDFHDDFLPHHPHPWTFPLPNPRRMPSWASTSSEPPRRAAPVPWAENGGTEPVLDLVLGARVGSPLVVSIGAFTKGISYVWSHPCEF